MSDRPILGFTMGDPAGVGPEVCLHAATHPHVLSTCRPIIYGHEAVLTQVAKHCSLDVSIQQIQPGDDFVASAQNVACVQPANAPDISVQAGVVNKDSGLLSYQAFELAIQHANAGQIHGIVTAPIHKEAWDMAGIQHPGHTEVLADLTDTDRFCMMMTSPTLSCSLVTCHVGLGDVPGMITTDRILEVIQLTHESMQRIRKAAPKIAVLGLNPHAGEGGLFGDQEQKIIQPAIDAAKSKGIDVVGPMPPDTAFVPSKLKELDAHVCMYHDQGLIPFKALAFDTGVNVTLGLPIVRTSVDHGTALDIAWQGKVDPSSMLAAVELAVQLAER